MQNRRTLSILSDVKLKKSARAISAQLIPHVRALAESLQSASDGQLRNEVSFIRREMARGLSITEPHLLTAGLALATESLRRTLSVTLYDVQLLAAISMTRCCIAHMQMGEGKTFAALAAALHLSLTGRGVHVITANVCLAERDYQLAAKVASPLGITVSLLPEFVDAAEKTPAYEADVTYGTGHEFGLDYLRDQSTMREESRQRLNALLLDNLTRNVRSRRRSMQRGLAYAVVDEAVSVLIDDAGSPLVLTFDSNACAADADAHLAARLLTANLLQDVDFVLEQSSGRVALTEAGVQRCHADDVSIPVLQLVRPWTEYVQQALRARFFLRGGLHYVIQNDEIQILDETTGRILEDRPWQDGLIQAIEASQNLPITAEKNAVAQVSRQRYFGSYENLCGVTSAAIGSEREFNDIYDLTVEEIPPRVPSQRVVLPTRMFANNTAKYHAITSDVELVLQLGRAVLIGTRQISDSETLAAMLASHDIECQLLYGLQDAAEADFIRRAGHPRSVTIATNLAGFGSDIPLHPEVRANGGLHVIVAECQIPSPRDRQLIDRCARQGDPGSAQVFASADDCLISLHGPWLVEELRREADANGEVDADFSRQFTRIQASADRQQYAARMNMLRNDMLSHLQDHIGTRVRTPESQTHGVPRSDGAFPKCELQSAARALS